MRRGVRPALAFALVLAALPAAAADAERTLCRGGESVLFSCRIGARLLSLCTRPEAPRLSYRFGVPGRVELDYAGPFLRSSLPGYGGGVTSVLFSRGGYDYAVYSRARRAPGGGDPETEDGVTVSRAGRRLKTWVCDDGGAGFRAGLDWLPRKPGE